MASYLEALNPKLFSAESPKSELWMGVIAELAAFDASNPEITQEALDAFAKKILLATRICMPWICGEITGRLRVAEIVNYNGSPSAEDLKYEADLTFARCTLGHLDQLAHY